MASASQPRRKYHVFLSFRGPDSRDNIISHLYDALDGRGIYTYIDIQELKKGERISDGLMNAIEESRIALIVFSEQYATSSWCLKEVAKIMECRKTNGLLVLPVFFKVDPREVRGGRESYKNAFDAYKNKCKSGKAVGFDLKDVEKWEKALFHAGGLSGWVYNKGVIVESKTGTLIQLESGEDEWVF
ncbi:TMV resistance protein N-like [Syzygium oleosum]|uniref:TMV resistance protein N-like n=1 Tax=Syzygium oleosum TaxID=219896 RepID=UPI0024BBE21C|nr:TMV resistance protein N-like [Syzygium oleosum]